MSKGFSGLFFGTIGSKIDFGSSYYMKPTDNFSVFIKNRNDVDTNDFYDIIAHGSEISIDIQHNGQTITVNHRVASRLFKQNKQYKGQGIRLLSCSTGKIDTGFAQNLANKLNVPVKAPTNILWAEQSGKYFVAAGKIVNGEFMPDLSQPGKFKTFYPQRRNKK
ncbi:MAG: hypothetical protein NC120_01255 [Ruminococcus sp.]|nr:hypothetical protein [Ruminococcus sp.]